MEPIMAQRCGFLGICQGLLLGVDCAEQIDQTARLE